MKKITVYGKGMPDFSGVFGPDADVSVTYTYVGQGGEPDCIILIVADSAVELVRDSLYSEETVKTFTVRETE